MKQSQAAGNLNPAISSKVESAKEELEDACNKVEQCRVGHTVNLGWWSRKFLLGTSQFIYRIAVARQN